MRYVSTRGEAPALDFVEVMLAGLARDGVLYVPESWPALDAEAIAGFAGRPYAEVAVEVIRPFVGASIPDADLARMAREAYGTFRHHDGGALASLTQHVVHQPGDQLHRQVLEGERRPVKQLQDEKAGAELRERRDRRMAESAVGLARHAGEILSLI